MPRKKTYSGTLLNTITIIWNIVHAFILSFYHLPYHNHNHEGLNPFSHGQNLISCFITMSTMMVLTFLFFASSFSLLSWLPSFFNHLSWSSCTFHGSSQSQARQLWSPSSSNFLVSPSSFSRISSRSQPWWCWSSCGLVFLHICTHLSHHN